MYLQTKGRGEGRKKKKRYKPILSIELKPIKAARKAPRICDFPLQQHKQVTENKNELQGNAWRSSH